MKISRCGKVYRQAVVLILMLLCGVVPSTLQAASKMYWVDADVPRIQRSNIDGTDVETLVANHLDGPRDIALDVVNGKVYWVDPDAQKIFRSNLDSSEIEAIVTTGVDGPHGVALHVDNGKIYWVEPDASRIRRANLDGTDIETLVTGLDAPHGIDLDLSNEKMYWVDADAPRIQRANLDGSGVETLVTAGLDGPRGIALDVAGGKMYWADPDAQRIKRANLDGSDVETLVTAGLDRPHNIALDLSRDKMYWVDPDASRIQRANLDGSDVETLVNSGLEAPHGIDLRVDLVITKVTVKAGKDRSNPKDSVNISGDFYADIDDLSSADFISVTIGTESVILFDETIAVDEDDIIRNKYRYKGSAGKILRLRLNFKKEKLKLKAKAIDLSRLTSPVVVGLSFGNFDEVAEADEEVVNGAKKAIPMMLLMGEADALRVDKHSFKVRTKPDSDKLKIQGAIAVADTNTDLTLIDVLIQWGDFSVNIPAGDMVRLGAKQAFKYKKPSGSDSTIAKAIFNFDKATFKIVIKNADIGDQASPVNFNIVFFGSFDQTVQVPLP